MIRLKATALHPEHAEGTVYEAEPAHAASHLYLRQAVEASANDTVEPPKPFDRKQNYKRRDLRAEK